MPIERERMLGVANAERQRLGRTIQYAAPAVWDADSVCAGWRNRDIVAHLAAHEIAAAQLLNGDAAVEFDAFREANGGELWVNGFNEWAVKVRAEAPTRELIGDWGQAADGFLQLAARLSADDWFTTKVDWVAGEIGVRYLVQSRIIEWWFHGEDIREGAGLEENPQHWPVFMANDMAIRMLPWALEQAGLSFPGASLRVDLEGVGGGIVALGPRTGRVTSRGQEGRCLRPGARNRVRARGGTPRAGERIPGRRQPGRRRRRRPRDRDPRAHPRVRRVAIAFSG